MHNTDVDPLKMYLLSLLSVLPIIVSFILDFPRIGSAEQLILILSYSALLFTVYTALFRLHRLAFYVLLSLALLFAFAFSGFHLLTDRKIGYNVLASTYETNPRELFEFVTSGFFIKLSANSLAVYLIVFVFVTSNTYLTPDALRFLANRKSAAVALLLSALGCSYVSLSYDFDNFYPARTISKNYKYFAESYSVAKEYKQKAYRFHGDTDRRTKSNFILVIGEANRKASMSIYGGDADTTPELEKLKTLNPDNVLFFSDAISASAFTRVSVPSMLSAATAREYLQLAEYPSIIRILESVDFSTAVLSNQEKRSYYNDLITALFEEADTLDFFGWRNRGYDENLIPELSRYLDMENTESQFVALHLSGSHYDYRRRYPDSRSYFRPKTTENAYKDSIRYTDYVLSEFINQIMSQPEPYVMLYVSDHGEYVNDLNDGLYGHDMRNLTRFEAEIPFIVVFNAAFAALHHDQVEILRQRTEEPVSHDNVSHLIMGMLGVEDKNFYKPSLDPSAQEFVGYERYFIDQDLDINLYSEIEFSDDEDR